MQNEKRIIGQTKDAGFQIGARRTFPIHYKDAWRLLTSLEGVGIWLDSNVNLKWIKGEEYQLSDGTVGQVRVFKPHSHLRLTWHPKAWERASTLQIRVIPQDSKTVIAFHQEYLPGPETREERHIFFSKVLDKLEQLIRSGEQ